MISSGRRELGGGFERYTFEISTSYIQYAAAHSRGSEAVWKQRLCDWYLLSPRPDRRDIVSSQVRPAKAAGISLVTIVIRRGHFWLLHLMREYGTLTVDLDAGRVNGVDGDLVAWILPDAFPNYGKEFLSPPELGGDEAP